MSDDDDQIKTPLDEMENGFDDAFDAEDFDDEFDDLADQGTTLGDLWRNNAFVKIGVIIAALILFILIISIFSGGGGKAPDSRVSRSTDLTEAPGSSEVSESYRQAVEEENNRRIEDAIRQSESAVPTPVEPPKGTLPLQFEEPEEEDPLERWRRMQEERLRQQQIQVEDAAPPPAPEEDTRTPAVNALAQAMSQQMESVLANQQIKSPQTLSIADLGYLENLAEQERQQREAELERLRQQREARALAAGAAGASDIEILLPAGTIEYAQLITEANSDVPGPILAEIATGPLRGGRLIGSFESTGKLLTLSFSAVILDGVDYPVSGVAIDPETTLPGVATDVNSRLFKRVFLPAAAEFITGFTDAVSNSGRTSITISGDSVSETTDNDDLSTDQEVASGIAELGEELEEIIDDTVDDIEPLVRVRAGTSVGVLFTSAVVDQARAPVVTPPQGLNIAPVNLGPANNGQAPLPFGVNSLNPVNLTQ